jgi:hypothetical protein
MNHGSHDMGSGSDMGSGADQSVLDSMPDGAICIDGKYPLFKTPALSMAAHPGMSHGMTFGNHMTGEYTLYMPNADVPDKNMMPGVPCPTSAIDASGFVAMPTTAFCAMGYYPLYKTSYLAAMASPSTTSHVHTMGEFSLYMPNGVEMQHRMSGHCDSAWDDQSANLGVSGGYTGPPPINDGYIVAIIAPVVVVVGAIIACFLFKAGRASQPKEAFTAAA